MAPSHEIGKHTEEHERQFEGRQSHAGTSNHLAEVMRQRNVAQALKNGSLSYLQRHPALIVLTGHPGVGKKTIATKPHEIINHTTPLDAIQDYENYSILFHNHLILDLALAVAPWGETHRHVGLREKLLEASLGCMLKDPNKNRTFIMTAQVQVDPTRRRVSELQRISEFGAERGLPICWFDLSCSNVQVHLERLTHEDRSASKTKDADLLQRHFEDPLYRQARPSDLEYSRDWSSVGYLDIDTYGMELDDVAMQMLVAVMTRKRNTEA